MAKLRMLSLCSGIGGLDIAAEMTDAIEVVGQVEIDPFSGAATVALGDEQLRRDLLPPAMKHTALSLIPATLWDDPPG